MLYYKLCYVVRQLLEQILFVIKYGNILEIVQCENEVICFGCRMLDDSFFEWYKLVFVLYNMVCVVVDLWLGVFSYVGNQKFIVWLLCVYFYVSKVQLGSVIFVVLLLIVCGDGVLEIVIGQVGDGIIMQGL